MKRRNRSLWNRMTSSPLAILALLIAAFVLVRAAWHIHDKAVESERRLSEAQNDLFELEAHRSGLEAQVAYLSTPEGLESEIRSKFRAAVPGESVAVVVDDASSTASGQASSTPAETSWWSRFIGALGF